MMLPLEILDLIYSKSHMKTKAIFICTCKYFLKSKIPKGYTGIKQRCQHAIFQKYDKDTLIDNINIQCTRLSTCYIDTFQNGIVNLNLNRIKKISVNGSGIHSLFLSNNNIECLENQFLDMPNISYVILKGCCMCTIKNSFNNIPLKELNLSYNYLHKINDSFNGLDLAILNLSSNRLMDLDSFSNCNIENLNISDNLCLRNINGIKGKNITQLKINCVKLFHYDIISTLINLTYLEICGCELTDVYILNGLTKLENLSASNNQIANIDCLGNLPLVHLNVSHNRIKTANYLSPSLVHLDISFNYIFKLPDTSNLKLDKYFFQGNRYS